MNSPRKEKRREEKQRKMSFLAGRLASTEGAYFLQESKHAVGRLAEKTTKKKLPSDNNPSGDSSSSLVVENEAQAKVLPEVLRRYLPSKLFEQPSDSSLSTASRWALYVDPNKWSPVSANALNPLRAYLSLPQVTFGPKRFTAYCSPEFTFGSSEEHSFVQRIRFPQN